MKRSRSRRSSVPSRRRPVRRSRGGVDVYLLPAVVGSGRGDVEDVLLVGHRLARAGRRVSVVRTRARPLALLRDETFDWTGIERTVRLLPRSDRAITISSQFGVTAADARDEPYGRAGPWAIERAEIDRAYGPGHVLHVSLEEFARGRPMRELAEERWREAGRTERARRAKPDRGSSTEEVAEFTRLYRKFRALDRTDLLVLFPTFHRSTRFDRDLPEIVQVGPIWPERLETRRTSRRSGGLSVLWYASPSTSDRLAPLLIRGLERARRKVVLIVRSPRPMEIPPSERVRPEIWNARSPASWRGAWSRSDLAIVTGTRSLLEAMAWKVPFLYFNGVLGRGRSARRHRPEKIAALLRWMHASGIPPDVRRGLSDFSRLRRVEGIVAASLNPPPAAPRGLPGSIARGFPPRFGDCGELVADVVERFAVGDTSPSELIARLRRESRRRYRAAAFAASKV